MQGLGTESDDMARESVFNSIEGCLIATLQLNVEEQFLYRLETDILNALQRAEYKTLIIDATPLELIDTRDFNRLHKMIDKAHLMGVDTIIVGMNPGVVASLVEMEADIEGLVTTLDMEKALQIVRRTEQHI